MKEEISRGPSTSKGALFPESVSWPDERDPEATAEGINVN
jgi:hypothetical protein